MPCVRGLRTCARRVGCARQQRRHVGALLVGRSRARSLAHLNFEKVLGRPVDLVETLLPRVGHGLHDGPVEVGALRRRRPRLGGRAGGGGLVVAAGGPPGVLLARQFGGGCPRGRLGSVGCGWWIRPRRRRHRRRRRSSARNGLAAQARWYRAREVGGVQAGPNGAAVGVVQ